MSRRQNSWKTGLPIIFIGIFGTVALAYFLEGSMRLKKIKKMSISDKDVVAYESAEKKEPFNLEKERERMMERMDLSLWSNKPIPRTKEQLEIDKKFL